jgi:hypothetical protein
MYALVCNLLFLENCTEKHRVFTVITCFENMSIVQTQRHFSHEFDVPRHGRNPSQGANLKSLEDFSIHVSKSVGPTYSVLTPGNVEGMRAMMQRS